MTLNPNIPLQAMTPGQAQEQTLQNELRKQQIDKNSREAKAAEQNAGKPNYDEIEKKMDIGMKILSTVKDQASYDRARQLATQYGIDDLDMLPAQYDPAIVEQLGRASMTFAEQIKMQRQEQAMDFDRERFEYGKERDQVDDQYRSEKLDIERGQQSRIENRQERQMALGEKKFDFEMRKYAEELDRMEQEAQNPQSNLDPMPVGALKALREDMTDIGLSGQISADLGVIEQQINDGSLKLGLMQNMGSSARNFVGASDEVSRNYQTFKSTLQKLRNDSLRLNKGVQTEGDAQRAWDELIANTNDAEFVKQRLGEIRAINERAAALKKQGADMTLQNYGRPPMPDLVFDQPAAIGGAGQDEGFSRVDPGAALQDMQGGQPSGGSNAIEEELRRRGLVQ